MSSAEGVNQTKVFRWLNFGSCTMRYAFDTPEFFRGEYQGLPLQVSKVWRREISSLMSDWEVAEQRKLNLPPSQFSEAWLSSRKIFQDADAVLVDLVLDIFRKECLRFRRSDDGAFPAYPQVISNFPEEPPAELCEDIGVFACDQERSIRAWQRFGEEVKTPTVFITIEHRDDLKSLYSPRFRQALLNYQAAIEKLAAQFPHWLVVDMDELFSPFGNDCYIDSHHPTDLGWKVLRESVPQIMIEKGILAKNPGGAPLPIGTKYIPERSDFGVLDVQHIARLAQLEVETCAVGPARLTATAKAAFGSQLQCFASFTALKNAKPPALIVALKWDQPAKLPAWLTGLMKQHPTALIELPCLWEDRERRFLSADEFELRGKLRAFGEANAGRQIGYDTLAPDRLLYLARCLLKTHRTTKGAAILNPVQSAASPAEVTPLPIALAERLSKPDLVPVFGASS